MASGAREYVSRGGEKLNAALDAFGVRCAGLTCADFGCNVGGFTDCLLRRGARRVYAVDTGYGQLAWKLRTDERVEVMERTNALYADAPGTMDLVVIDMAWTPQRLSVPAAMRWLGGGGQVVSLLKPHYERAKLPGRPAGGRTRAGTLSDEAAADVCRRICDELAGLGWAPEASITSPVRGKGGNLEFFLRLRKGAAERVIRTDSQSP